MPGMTSLNPRPYAAAGASVDQVLRLEEFRRRHPSVEIASPRQNETPAWSAIWDTERGYDQISRYELRTLLDNLEDTFDVEGPEPGE